MSVKTKLTKVIAQCHKELNEIFLLHQEAALLGMFDEAAQLLDCFKKLHHLHMVFEDEKLITKLDGLGNPGRWPVSLYTDEHAKIQELMEKTEYSLLSLGNGQLSDNYFRRRVISFLDKERTFKGLCEHHQEREETDILPELDMRTDKKWRTNVIGPFLKEWNYCMEHNMVGVIGIDFPQQNGADKSLFVNYNAGSGIFKSLDAPGEK